MPAEIHLDTTSIAFSALGQTQQLTATVVDARGNTLDDVEVTWRSANSGVASVAGGLVTAQGAGSAKITASAGAASAMATVDVAPTAAMLRKIDGDLQSAVAGTELPIPLTVLAIDANDHPVAGVTIEFSAPAGGMTFYQPTVMTGADGRAWVVATVRGAGTLPVQAQVQGTSTSVVFELTGSPAAPAQLLLEGGNNLTVAPGTSVHPLLRVTDEFGNGVPGVTFRTDITAGGGTVSDTPDGTQASTYTGTSNADGTVDFYWSVPSAGEHHVALAVQGVSLAGSPLTLTTIATSGFISPYNIELRFVSPVTSSQLLAFGAAERRWERHIVGDLPDFSVSFSEICGEGTPPFSGDIDDLLIFVELANIDGTGGVLAAAGPCLIRQSNGLPLAGYMYFDTADLASLQSGGILDDVVLHEMGHVLGFGTVWDLKGLLADAVHDNGTDPHFTGTNAIAAFNAAGGSTYLDGAKVPVENNGGPGTADSHWRESVLGTELMTGYVDYGSNPLSAITIRSLQDLGYAVDASGADAFTLGAGVRLQSAEPPVILKDDVRQGTIHRIGADGRLTARFRSSR